LKDEIVEAKKSLEDRSRCIYYRNEQNISCSVRITTDLAKTILFRLDTKFELMFGGFLSKVLDNGFGDASLGRTSASLFLDPRLRDWFLGMKKYSRSHWWEELQKWCQKVTELRESEDEVNKLPEVEEERRRSPKRFKTGAVMKRSKEVSNQSDTILKKYDEMEVVFPCSDEGINIFDQFMGKEQEVLNPFSWWEKTVESYPSMEPLRKAAMIALTFQLASAFSESQFSFAERITSGVRASTGVKTLNIYQFVRFNSEVIKEELYKSFEEIHENASDYAKLIDEKNENFLKYVNEEEDSEIFSEVESISSISTIKSLTRQCPICNDTTLKRMERTELDKSLNITCDEEDCKRKGEPLSNCDEFYACIACDEYDICKLCYDKKSQ